MLLQADFLLEKLSKQLETRKLVVDKYLENPQNSLRNIAKALKLNQKTVSNTINQFLATQSIERKKGSSRKSGKI